MVTLLHMYVNSFNTMLGLFAPVFLASSRSILNAYPLLSNLCKAIPEAMPERPDTTKFATLPSLSLSDTILYPRLGGNGTIAAAAPPRQRFPAEWEGAIHDAANAWSKPGVGTDSFLSEGASSTEIFAANGEWRETPNGSRHGGSMHGQTATSNVAATTGFSAVVDGGMMPPFDMDIPVAYSMTAAGITGGMKNAVAARNELVSPGAVPAVEPGEDKDEIDRRAIEAATIMENIDTDRIPCPRLCGATFSSGVGGLAGEKTCIDPFETRGLRGAISCVPDALTFVVFVSLWALAFHNGNVQKMWHWWECSDPTRLSAIPGLIGEPSVNDPKKSKSISNMSTGEVTGRLPTTCSPRTLKDLLIMTKAAKEAQWGQHDESDASSTGFPTLGGNFFEDDSDASSESADESLEERVEVSELKRQPKDYFGNYFDTRQRPAPVPLSSDISKETSVQASRGDDAPSRVFSPSVGPVSDMLTPLVKVSHEFDRIALSGQSPDLALGWELGDLRVGPHYGVHPLPDATHLPLLSKIKQRTSLFNMRYDFLIVLPLISLFFCSSAKLSFFAGAKKHDARGGTRRAWWRARNAAEHAGIHGIFAETLFTSKAGRYQHFLLQPHLTTR